MADNEIRPTTVVAREPSGGGLYFIVGALVVLVLVGGYVMLGAPGLNTQVAKGPAAPAKVDVTVQQPAATPSAPAATPAAKP
ncbi:MAG: hypothetical protein JSR47_04140 [Proteobacteria bacterium]|nr:hypothetical protein [Pseudomonadota bacterium]